MMEKMIFGRFIPGDSFVHRMDPRAKILFVFLFIAIVFVANNTLTYLLLLAFYLFCGVFIKNSPLFLSEWLKAGLYFVDFYLYAAYLLYEGRRPSFSFGFVEVYEEGLRQGIFISIRFLVLVFITSILTLTTSPISITDGIEVLLGPFKRIKLPVHELALMMSISLRFIPTLMDETGKILKAQMARGSDIGSGPLKKRIKAVVPLLIPFVCQRL
ncbi:energy-coupling factor transporter transmembrane protein EcfT [Planococcus glaciei]|nr:energy-coupling factor transporter transmembrane protein EcfT [Planococcus glaciei]QDY45439.1 energy-coupling factor transporter transmembrane protein EcfT [Planococcus glaciei]